MYLIILIIICKILDKIGHTIYATHITEKLGMFDKKENNLDIWFHFTLAGWTTTYILYTTI